MSLIDMFCFFIMQLIALRNLKYNGLYNLIWQTDKLYNSLCFFNLCHRSIFSVLLFLCKMHHSQCQHGQYTSVFETFQIVLECVDKLVLEVYQNELVRKTRTISYSLLNVVLGLKIWCEKNSLQPKSYNTPTCTVTYQTTTCSIIFRPLAFYRIQRCNLLTSPLITRNIMIKCKRCSIHSRPP